MARRRTSDPKILRLREHGCLHPHPEQVRDASFVSSEFFDARDLVQVKYEMLRRVQVEGQPVSRSAASFGFSRPTFYQAQGAFEAGGLPSLVPKKPGPRRAHKLSEEVIAFLEETLSQEGTLLAAELARRIKERFGRSVHPRSVERALARHKKKLQRPGPAST
ncbi:MAG TPA: helix-turn-helix domain-containing protein [Myxococcota bacterium]|nr:helix-turn-helix domain-containing protein [Myxococcota bacterium]